MLNEINLNNNYFVHTSKFDQSNLEDSNLVIDNRLDTECNTINFEITIQSSDSIQNIKGGSSWLFNPEVITHFPSNDNAITPDTATNKKVVEINTSFIPNENGIVVLYLDKVPDTTSGMILTNGTKSISLFEIEGNRVSGIPVNGASFIGEEGNTYYIDNAENSCKILSVYTSAYFLQTLLFVPEDLANDDFNILVKKEFFKNTTEQIPGL